MKKSDFYFDLPSELIAQTPLEPRDSSRLLCYNRATNQIDDKNFYNLPDLLQKGDVLVMNNTKVLPARLIGNKINTPTASNLSDLNNQNIQNNQNNQSNHNTQNIHNAQNAQINQNIQSNTQTDLQENNDDNQPHQDNAQGAKVEFLLLKRLNLTQWNVLVKPAKRLKIGTIVQFSPQLSAKIIKNGEMGERTVEFIFDGVFEDILHKIGEMPLPHYIHERLSNPNRYQTVYAKTEGSAAAPTAGLHFTQQLLEQIKNKGVEIAQILLHVGLGTFRPVKSDDIKDHVMHSEYYEISPESAQIINTAIKEGRRIIAVGTTSVRVLESVADQNGMVKPCSGNTNIFIYPPYKFKAVNAIITNFHLPESTLVMLISAFLTKEKTLDLYNHAIKNRYRFFSFGDSMFLS